MGPEPQGQTPLKPKTLDRIRQYIDAFNRHGQRMDKLEKSIADLTDAVDNLTNVMTLWSDLMAKAADSPHPVETFMRMMAEVLRQRPRG